MKNLFKEKYKKEEVVYFWYDEFGAMSSTVWYWNELEDAYLMSNGIYLRKYAKIFKNKEELYEYAKTHKKNNSTDCGYSFGCDFLPFY